MKDNNKTNEQLLNEISKLNNKIAELEKIRLIGEKTTDFISIIGLDGKYTYASPSYKLLGYNPDELIGSDGIKQLHPDDRKRMLPMLKQVISGLFKKGTTKRFEIRLRDKSGKYHDAESIATLIRDDSGNPRILSVVRDITKRKQAEEALQESEEKFRNFVETSADLVFRLTKTGRIDYVSSRVEDLYGYKPDELIGKYLRTTTPVGEVTKAIKGINVLLTGKPIKNFEINQKTKAGRIIPMEINAVPVYQSGKIVGFQGIMRDITERKQAEEKLKSRNKELETWAEVTTGRELKMLELKKEINELLEKSGEKSKYEIPI